MSENNKWENIPYFVNIGITGIAIFQLPNGRKIFLNNVKGNSCKFFFYEVRKNHSHSLHEFVYRGNSFENFTNIIKESLEKIEKGEFL